MLATHVTTRLFLDSLVVQMISSSSFDVLFMVGQRLMEMQQELESETGAGSVLGRIKLDKYIATSEGCELLAREYQVRQCSKHSVGWSSNMC